MIPDQLLDFLGDLVHCLIRVDFLKLTTRLLFQGVRYSQGGRILLWQFPAFQAGIAAVDRIFGVASDGDWLSIFNIDFDGAVGVTKSAEGLVGRNGHGVFPGLPIWEVVYAIWLVKVPRSK